VLGGGIVDAAVSSSGFPLTSRSVETIAIVFLGGIFGDLDSLLPIPF
jgi:hypothetical protein